MSYVTRSEAESKFPFNLTDGKSDHHAWFKRIIHRKEHGDKDLTQAQINMAYAAAYEVGYLKKAA